MYKLKLATIFASCLLALPAFFPELVAFGLPFRVALFIVGVSMIIIIIVVDEKDKKMSKK